MYFVKFEINFQIISKPSLRYFYFSMGKSGSKDFDVLGVGTPFRKETT